MEEKAIEMVEESPSLQKEFDAWMKENPDMVDKPRQRLNFFYERSPYFDKKLNLYPVYRIEKAIDL
jgi:hypothetical protein